MEGMDHGTSTKRKRKAEGFRSKKRQVPDDSTADTTNAADAADPADAIRSQHICSTSTQFGKAEKATRKYILFVGNLPYTTSQESISEHFARVRPVIRVATCKGDATKCKGFAFLQFEGESSYERFSAALGYHHTLLDGRKINVELTGGGGGGSEHRKEKIMEKNERLQEARQKKMDEHHSANETKTTVKRRDLHKTHPERRSNIS